MKNFWRILSYSRPLGTKVPQYVGLTLLYTIFSLVNLTVLIPLLDILFDKVDPTVLASNPPEFSFALDYFKDTFYYYFHKVIIENGKAAALQFVCVIILVSVLLSNIFKYLSAMILVGLRVRVLKNMRMHIFSNIINLHLGYFTEQKKGDLISRMTVDIQEIQNSVTNSLKVLFKEPLLLIGYFVILFGISAKLTFFTLLILPISGSVISIIARRLRKRAHQSQESLGKLLNILDESISGMRIVKAFNAEKKTIDRFSDEVSNNEKYSYSVLQKFELAGPISEVLGISAVAVILLVGGNMAISGNGELTASQFMGFLIVFTQVLSPAKAISASIANINKGLAAAERIFSILDQKPQVKESKTAIPISEFKDSIKFSDVNFAYDSDEVLSKINLEVKRGEIVALIGPSGGGKSTMADLIPRFYDPRSGSLTIDGNDIRDLKIEDLRSLMGIVAQESILFNDTIANNIAFGKDKLDMAEVQEAAKVANAHDFIMQTTDGYNTIIGERGTKLSGGQRQRISIARAVLKNPDILILDEATSALDSESEKLVQQALVNLMRDRTSIVIAHRLSTVQSADKIIVIKEGKIIETGNHESLMKANGMYQKLISLQSV